MHGLRGGIHQRGALLNAGDRLFYQPFDLFRRVGAATGEVSDFTGNHREPAPLLSGTRRFNGRVQRQNIGLERDTVDDADNVANFLRAGGNLLHRAGDVRSLVAPTFRRHRRLF